MGDILMRDLKVGDYFMLKNGVIYKVLCNDWFDPDNLRDFICVDSNGNKKHYGFLNGDTKFSNVELVAGFKADTLLDKYKTALKTIAYQTDMFSDKQEIERFALDVLAGEDKCAKDVVL